MAVINSLVSRGHRVCDEEAWSDEKQHLLKVLSGNGYKIRDIQRAIAKQENPNVAAEPKSYSEIHRKAYLPYIRGTSDKISTLLRRHDIRTIFVSGKTTRQMIGSVKDPLPLKTSGVYEIPCSCGKSYIGQTGRLISTRLQEHIRAVKNDDRKSAVAEHSSETGHLISFEKTKILAPISRYKNRIIREAIEIEKNNNNFNREEGFRLSRTWKPLVYQLNKQRSVNTRDQLPQVAEGTAEETPGSPTNTTVNNSSYNLRPRTGINTSSPSRPASSSRFTKGNS